jgi:hypothetical protein
MVMREPALAIRGQMIVRPSMFVAIAGLCGMAEVTPAQLVAAVFGLDMEVTA